MFNKNRFQNLFCIFVCHNGCWIRIWIFSIPLLCLHPLKISMKNGGLFGIAGIYQRAAEILDLTGWKRE